MSKIATYPSADTPLLLSDRLIGTEAIRTPPSLTPLATKNFSLGELLNLFSSNFPAASLQEVLNTGNTATQNITLIGTINTTVVKPYNIEDPTGSQGLTFQFLSKGASSINWVDLPVDNLQSVLNAGNTATQNITLVGDITSTKIIPGNIQDDTLGIGTTGQLLSKTATGIRWINNPIVYTPGLADVLSVGNTATNNINLVGTIDVTLVRPDNIEDIVGSQGTLAQVLSKGASGIVWINAPSGADSWDTWTPDANIGLRLKPTDTNVNGTYFERNANGNTGYVNKNTSSGTGAVSTLSAGLGTGIYTRNTGINHFGDNYYVVKFRGNGALLSTDKLYIGTYDINKDIEFITGADFNSTTTKFKVGYDGQLNIGTTPTTGATSDKLLVRDSSGNVKQVNYPVSPLTTKGDLYTYSTVDARLPVGLNTQILIADSTAPTGLKWGTNTAATPLGYYGAFSDITDQFATVINTGYPMLLGVTDLTNGVTVVSGSRVTIANTGIYNIQWSAQFRNPTANVHDVTIWLRKNGVDVPGSAGVVAVTAKHGSFDGHVLPSWNFLLDAIAGDYYEFVWSTDNVSVFISFQPAGSPPPSTASVVLTVTQQSGIMAGTGMTALTTAGASGASTYNSGTGILNVPTYTLSGLGGAPKDEFSGLTPISSAALLALANTNALVIGQVYKVEETKFYNSLATVYVYVKATSVNTIDEENAIAEFLDPDYITYGIYNPSNSYNAPNRVIWGGLLWEAQGPVSPGANINNYELNSADFNILTTPALFNVVMDNVSYSIEFEMIYSRRNHYCNFTCDPAILLIGNVKIRNMQWGNYYNSGISEGLRGINCLNSDLNIINSRVILLTEITLINSFVAVGNNRTLDDLVFANSGTFASPNTIVSNISSRFFANTMTATVGGLVPTPPNNTTTFLRGDGTFAAPAGGGSSQVKLSAQTLAFASWVLVGNFYEYTFANANIVSTGFVNFTPNNASINEVSTCRMLPQIDAAAGTCKFYSLFPPQTNIVGEIVIFIL